MEYSKNVEVILFLNQRRDPGPDLVVNVIVAAAISVDGQLFLDGSFDRLYLVDRILLTTYDNPLDVS